MGGMNRVVGQDRNARLIYARVHDGLSPARALSQTFTFPIRRVSFHQPPSTMLALQIPGPNVDRSRFSASYRHKVIAREQVPTLSTPPNAPRSSQYDIAIVSMNAVGRRHALASPAHADPGRAPKQWTDIRRQCRILRFLHRQKHFLSAPPIPISVQER